MQISKLKKCYYYHELCFPNYLKEKCGHDDNIKFIIFLAIVCLALTLIGISKPLFANTGEINNIKKDTGQEIYLQKNFEENIKNKYAGSYVNFPTVGIAHIKKVKYINSKPVKINIVELNTKVNPNLLIKPSLASDKLNSKSTVRKIAKQNRAIVALNGGFFKPQTGTPLGALMINGEILTGPIYNRVGIGIFNKDNETYFKMGNINFDIKLHTKSGSYKIDNINQPRMLAAYTLMYTNSWGKYCPEAKNGNWNLSITGNKVDKVSANPIELKENNIIIQGNKELIKQLIKDKEIYIDAKLQDEFKDANHIISAGPYLVKNSEIYVDYKEQKLQAISGKNPRSAIGYKNDGTLILVAIDGREESSVGMTLYELAKYMKSLGCEYAMNFDGGSSSAMFVNGKIVNSAVNSEGIAVSNALVVSEQFKNEIQISSL